MTNKYEQIPKRARNGIEARLKQIVGKYGYENTRLVVNRYFTMERERSKLEKKIIEAEKELRELKRNKKI